METVSLVLAAVDWGKEAVAAAKNKKQQRSANILERAALLAAGMRYLDRRFGELFIPLTFYDEATWPLDKRQQHASEMLDFIFNDRVVSDMGQAMTWLMSSPADDMHAQALVESLVDVTSAALAGGQADVDTDQLVAVLDDDSLDFHRLPTTWADQARWMIDPMAGPDSYAAPFVVSLVELLRSASPDAAEVRETARQCLSAPADLGPVMTEPGLIPRNLGVVRHAHRTGWLGQSSLPPTVSPLHKFADIVGARFQELLACLQSSFPGIPTPRWVYSA